ncbi:MAG: site-2 protease family protein [Eubacteriales bacterium]|nr:site-2 protease family protein [Eubacteriales bacterium]
MKLFSLGQTEVRVHLGLFVVVAIVCVQGRLYELLMALIALVLHESAHAMIARNVGCAVTSITLYPFGAEARIDANTLQNRALSMIACAGPIASFVIAGLCVLVMTAVPVTEVGLKAFWKYNLILALVNLLPAYPLDGGRLLFCLLRIKLRDRIAKAIAAWTGIFFGSVALASAIYCTMYFTTSLTLYMLGGFLLVAAAKEVLSLPNAQLMATVGKNAAVKRGESVTVRYSAVHCRMSAADALHDFRNREFNLLRVVDDGMRTVGELDEGALIEGIGKFGMSATVGEILGFDLRKTL